MDILAKIDGLSDSDLIAANRVLNQLFEDKFQGNTLAKVGDVERATVIKSALIVGDAMEARGLAIDRTSPLALYARDLSNGLIGRDETLVLSDQDLWESDESVEPVPPCQPSSEDGLEPVDISEGVDYGPPEVSGSEDG